MVSDSLQTHINSCTVSEVKRYNKS